MNNWAWKEGIQFAFAVELLSEKGTTIHYKMSFAEKFGSRLLRPLYRMTELVSKNIKRPLAICLFTIAAALIAALIFYNIPIFIILGKLFPTQLIRGLLFFYVELNILAMGCRAFGRFNNKALVDLWKKGQIVAVLPGDSKI